MEGRLGIQGRARRGDGAVKTSRNRLLQEQFNGACSLDAVRGKFARSANPGCTRATSCNNHSGRGQQTQRFAVVLRQRPTLAQFEVMFQIELGKTWQAFGRDLPLILAT